MASLAPISITPRRSKDRGHADHGWLDSHHTFSFAGYSDPKHAGFGALRVLNEDRVAPNSGFPTHPHRDFEIFSYILSGELTHRDSIKGRGDATASSNDFFRMHRSDVQFTTGGTGIAHSEFNEHGSDWVHFLQIWVRPWANGLPPNYHTQTFSDDAKRRGFVPIISPLKAGKGASAADEKAAVPVLAETIPIHADFVMAAAIVPAGESRTYKVGSDAVASTAGRHVYVHLPATQGGKARVTIGAGEQEHSLDEGDGAYILVDAGAELVVASIGAAEAETVVLDSA